MEYLKNVYIFKSDIELLKAAGNALTDAGYAMEKFDDFVRYLAWQVEEANNEST